MHRVELKVSWTVSFITEKDKFLMHRVELKDPPYAYISSSAKLQVPNAPCGVESLIGMWC